MEDEQILANAPEGATHVDAAENYYVNDVCDWELIEAVKGNAFIYQDASISDFESMRSLSDIRELVELRKEIELSRLQLAESYKRESYQSEEITGLRREKFKRFNEEEYWIYQEGEDNYAESLVCPVTMSADQLRGFIGNTFSEAHNLEQQAEGVMKAADVREINWSEGDRPTLHLLAKQLRQQAKGLAK
ncbi:hypothetical protein P4S73_04835 [Paraglaciecola sp. Hal342]|jgi:hypothetical protein